MNFLFLFSQIFTVFEACFRYFYSVVKILNCPNFSMEESDTTPEQSVKAEEQASDAGLKIAKTDDSSSQMAKFERENAKAYSKYKKETIGRVNWHVDRILKGNAKTKECEYWLQLKAIAFNVFFFVAQNQWYLK